MKDKYTTSLLSTPSANINGLGTSREIPIFYNGFGVSIKHEGRYDNEKNNYIVYLCDS